MQSQKFDIMIKQIATYLRVKLHRFQSDTAAFNKIHISKFHTAMDCF